MAAHSIKFFVAAYIDGLGVRVFTTPGHISEVCKAYLEAKRPECTEHYHKVMGAAAAPAQQPVVCPFGFVTTKSIPGVFPPIVVSGLETDIEKSDELARGLATEITVLVEQVAAAVQKREYEHLEAAIHDVRHLNASILQHSERILDDEGLRVGEEWDMERVYATPKLRRLLSLSNASKDLANALALHELSRDPKRANDDLVSTNVHKIFFRQTQVAADQLQSRNLRVNLAACRRELKLTKSFRLVPKILFDNAIKYAKPNSDIDISFEETPSSFRFYFRNQGLLMRPAETKLVMLRGYRGSNQGGATGSGLGLWIAKTIIEANAGKIDVETTPKTRTYAGMDEGETLVKIVVPAPANV